MGRSQITGEVVFKPQQYVDDKGVQRDGELISAQMGETGWVEWSDPGLLKGSPGTVRMYRDGHCRAIEVEEGHRKQGVGRQLIGALTERAMEKGFERVVILGATIYASPFYDKTISELKERGLVTSVSRELRRDEYNDAVDINYEIRLK